MQINININKSGFNILISLCYSQREFLMCLFFSYHKSVTTHLKKTDQYEV